MRALLDISPFYRGQLFFMSDDPYFRLNSGIENLLTDDCHIINQDQAAEACGKVSERYELECTDAAAKRIMELVNCGDVDTQSFKKPFDGFDLKRFQKRCINVMEHESNCMLQMSCGTGKTYTALFMACQRFDKGFAQKIVVWCPVALIYDWVRSFEQASNLTVATPPTNRCAADRAAWYESNDADVWVLNYERVRTVDKEPIRKALRGTNPVFIYDEVTKVKNRKSALHKEISKLRKAVGASSQIALTATPIVTGPEDFYNEFRILEPNVFGRVSDFERDFTYNYGERDIWGNYIGYQNLGMMHVKAGAHVFSATKDRPEIAAEFPQKQEILIPYELTPKMRKLYNDIYRYGKSLDPMERSGPLFMMTFMRICNMPEVLLKSHTYDDDVYGRQLFDIDQICKDYAKDIMDASNNRKLQIAMQKVDEIIGSGDKVIIFAQYTHNCLFPLAEYLSGRNALLYTGDTSLPEKERIKQLFKHDKEHNLLLMSDAGQVGLNFQECGYLMHYQTPVSHAAYEQRSDRVHRLDSPFDCITVMRFMCEDTIEERIEETMLGRRQMALDMGLGGQEYEEFGSISAADSDFFCGF